MENESDDMRDTVEGWVRTVVHREIDRACGRSPLVIQFADEVDEAVQEVAFVARTLDDLVSEEVERGIFRLDRPRDGQ